MDLLKAIFYTSSARLGNPENRTGLDLLEPTQLAPGLGIEPRFTVPKTAVLPLDDPGSEYIVRVKEGDVSSGEVPRGRD